MTYYFHPKFLNKLDNNIQTIVEVGARYGDESIKLAELFPHAQIYSFECNPLTINVCREKLSCYQNITFIPKGLGANNEQLPFYSYIQNNDGASSFFKRIDAARTQQLTGYLDITTLSNVMDEYKVEQIDLLCMDVQGFELNVLKGINNLSKIRYVILEEPKPIINQLYLPPNVHSKYIGAPSSVEIADFMTNNGFVEIERLEENKIEDNVMYKQTINT